MSLSRLITDKLALKNKKDLGPQEIIRGEKKASPEQLRDIVIRARAALQENPETVWPLISRLSAYQTTSGFFANKKLNVLLLIHAHQASLGHRNSIERLSKTLKEAEEEIERIIKRDRKDNAVGSFTKSVDFLREILEDDLPFFLSDVTGVQINTARRWAGGHGAMNKNAFTVCSVAGALFALYEERGWGKEGTRAWLYSSRPTGGRPRDMWVGFHKRLDPNLRAELKKLDLF